MGWGGFGKWGEGGVGGVGFDVPWVGIWKQGWGRTVDSAGTLGWCAGLFSLQWDTVLWCQWVLMIHVSKVLCYFSSSMIPIMLFK